MVDNAKCLGSCHRIMLGTCCMASIGGYGVGIHAGVGFHMGFLSLYVGSLSVNVEFRVRQSRFVLASF